MKTKLTKCLALSALAIGITSNAVAGEHSKTEKSCNLSTLKGLYHFSIEQSDMVAAGQYVFDGAGSGVRNVDTHYTGTTIPQPSTQTTTFSYFADSTVDCKYIIRGFAATDRQLYLAVSGDSGAITGEHSTNPLAPRVGYELIRGPKPPARH